jgi:hypothetical protein
MWRSSSDHVAHAGHGHWKERPRSNRDKRDPSSSSSSSTSTEDRSSGVGQAGHLRHSGKKMRSQRRSRCDGSRERSPYDRRRRSGLSKSSRRRRSSSGRRRSPSSPSGESFSHSRDSRRRPRSPHSRRHGRRSSSVSSRDRQREYHSHKGQSRRSPSPSDRRHHDEPTGRRNPSSSRRSPSSGRQYSPSGQRGQQTGTRFPRDLGDEAILAQLYCRICDVETEDEKKMSAHIYGARHIKNISQVKSDLCRRMEDVAKTSSRSPDRARVKDSDEEMAYHSETWRSMSTKKRVSTAIS